MVDEVKSQVEGEAANVQPGVETPQVTAEVPVTEQPGAEKASQEEVEVKPPKTYSEDEVKKRESEITSKLQAETAQYRNAMAQLAMASQQAQAAEAERQLNVKDREEVDQGLISQQDADQRRGLRQQNAELSRTSSQLQQYIQKQVAQGEVLGRVTMAYDLGTQYGINPDDLIKDPNIKTPTQMIQKAANMAIEARDTKLRAVTAKPETFDKGPGTGGESPTSEEQSLRQRYPSMFKK